MVAYNMFSQNNTTVKITFPQWHWVTQHCWENAVFIVILFCEKYEHIEGTTGAQLPRSQFVDLMILPDFTLP